MCMLLVFSLKVVTGRQTLMLRACISMQQALSPQSQRPMPSRWRQVGSGSLNATHPVSCHGLHNTISTTSSRSHTSSAV
jgi:hypothetical protein